VTCLAFLNENGNDKSGLLTNSLLANLEVSFLGLVDDYLSFLFWLIDVHDLLSSNSHRFLVRGRSRVNEGFVFARSVL
jgi:hypothetical protein